MSKPIAIEINDAGLVVAGERGVLATEPGYAVVEDGRILTGSEAYAQARTKPSRTSNRYWHELSAEEGSATIPGISSSAELAYAQLEATWARFRERADAVVLVVPSDFTRDQLGLLLGLALECQIPVRAMVDAAAAASVRPYPQRQMIYVDAGLHRVTVTPLEQGQEVTALEAQRLDSTGLAGLMDAFARRVAELFVLATRFDPFHQASTEQLIYDGLDDWLAELRSAETARLSIPFGEDSFSVELERGQLLGAAQGFYKALLQLIAQTRSGGQGLAVQLSDRIARLPGIVAELGRLDEAVIVGQEPGHAALAALEMRDQLADAEAPVKLYRHLQWRGAAVDQSPGERPDSAVEAPPAASAPVPTHLVYRGVAHPVNGEGVLIGRSPTGERRAIVLEDGASGVSRAHCEVSLRDGELRLRDLSSYGTFVNERRIAGEAVLRPADVIRIGSPGAELTAIVVGSGHDGDGANGA